MNHVSIIGSVLSPPVETNKNEQGISRWKFDKAVKKTEKGTAHTELYVTQPVSVWPSAVRFSRWISAEGRIEDKNDRPLLVAERIMDISNPENSEI